MYRAYVVRASELGNPKYDNTTLINQHLAYYQTIAHLLGFTSYAKVSLVLKWPVAPKPSFNFCKI